MKHFDTDLVIVGAGPIGIELACALKHAGYAFRHFEAAQIGATIEWWAPGTTFFSSSDRISIAGVPIQNLTQKKSTREEYLAYLRAVVTQYDLNIETYARVVGLKFLDPGFELTVQKGLNRHEFKLSAKKVVLAIGDMHRPRSINIPGEDLPQVSHYFRDPHFYFGKKVVIVGGKNSAAEAALRLFRIGCEVAISYRNADLSGSIKPWILPEVQSLIRHKQIAFYPETVPERIDAYSIFLKHRGQLTKLDCDFVLLLTGYEQNPELFKYAGVLLEGEGQRPKHSRQSMETNVPGLFVAGTGSAGTQVGGVREFIETCHVHVNRIVAALKGGSAPIEQAADANRELES